MVEIKRNVQQQNGMRRALGNEESGNDSRRTYEMLFPSESQNPCLIPDHLQD